MALTVEAALSDLSRGFSAKSEAPTPLAVEELIAQLVKALHSILDETLWYFGAS